jgi:hypothetical protein
MDTKKAGAIGGKAPMCHENDKKQRSKSARKAARHGGKGKHNTQSTVENCEAAEDTHKYSAKIHLFVRAFDRKPSCSIV